MTVVGMVVMEIVVAIFGGGEKEGVGGLLREPCIVGAGGSGGVAVVM